MTAAMTVAAYEVVVAVVVVVRDHRELAATLQSDHRALSLKPTSVKFALSSVGRVLSKITAVFITAVFTTAVIGVEELNKFGRFEEFFQKNVTSGRVTARAPKHWKT